MIENVPCTPAIHILPKSPYANGILVIMFGKNMTNEEKLDAIYEMTLQNHEVLKTIRRQQYFATIVRLIYWLIVLGFIGGAYYYLGPFISTISNNTSGIGDLFMQLNQLKDQLPEAKIFNHMMDGFQKSGTSTP